MTSVQHKSPTQQLRTPLPKASDTPTGSTCDCQPQTLNARQMSACLSVSHASTKRKRKRMREMTMMNSVRATVAPNVTEWSVYYDGLSDLISFISHLIWFSVFECYVGRKWPTSVLNEYGLLIAVRRHPGSHEICARTHDHWDNGPYPDSWILSVHSLSSTNSRPGLQ